MNRSDRNMRFGILCDGPKLPRWQVRCIDQLLGVPGVECSVLVVTDRGANNGQQVEEWVDLSFNGRPVDQVTGFPGGGKQTIESFDLDFILAFDHRYVHPDLLSIPRYGVWAFNFELPSNMKGVEADRTSRARLVRMTDAASGVIMREGRFLAFPHSAPKTLSELHQATCKWPAEVCTQLLAGDEIFSDEKVHVNLSRSTDTMVSATKWRSLQDKISHWNNALLKDDIWNIGVVDAPIESLLQNPVPDVRWLPAPPKGRYYADPFAVRADGRLHILFEDYCLSTKKGVISAIELDGGPATEAKMVMEQPGHMSYPFLLEHDGEIFCIPATADANEVALYRAQKLPDVWQREAALLESFEGVDSSVIQFDGLWWLFCGDRRNRPNLNLYIFYAENLTGPWVAHRKNPVKSDVRSSRPAGTPFIHDGCLFRPSQDSSRGYGSGIVINRVVELSREAFREEEVALLEPDSSGPYKHGLHTICKVGDKTIVDGKARVVRLASMRNKLAKIVS